MVILQSVDKKVWHSSVEQVIFTKKKNVFMFSLRHPLSIHSSFTIHPQHHCYNFRMLMNVFVCLCEKSHVLQLNRGAVKEKKRRRRRERGEEISKDSRGQEGRKETKKEENRRGGETQNEKGGEIGWKDGGREEIREEERKIGRKIRGKNNRKEDI